MSPMDELGPTEHLVYHYTRAPTALEWILQTMRIRLGPVLDTNDPWEARLPTTWMCEAPGTPEQRERIESVSEPARRALEQALSRARVACFCEDEVAPVDDPARAQLFAPSSRGWARDRMWAQYADAHRGVCLAFDREKLLNAFHSELAGHGDCLAGRVEYDDLHSTMGFHTPNLDDAARLGSEKYALAYRSRHAQERYFTKRLDWSGEREWRLVLFDDKPGGDHAFVRIVEALSVVFVGNRFSEAYRPCVQAICDRVGIRAFQVRYGGFVTASRYDLAPTETIGA